MPTEPIFDCDLVPTDSSDDDDDEPYVIDLPDDFVARHMGELLSGLATICIPGGKAIAPQHQFDRGVIFIPPNAKIALTVSKREGLSQHRASANQRTEKTLLVVRILGDDGNEVPVESRDQLAGAVFGRGSRPLSNSLSAQFGRCSFGQLEFVPASGHPRISNGVMNVPINIRLEGKEIHQIRTGFVEETARLLGVTSLQATFDFVIFCVAAGTRKDSGDWLAFASVPGQFSFYNSEKERCDKLSSLMHEVGHSLGLHHSGDPYNAIYGDTTGVVRSQTHTTCHTFRADS